MMDSRVLKKWAKTSPLVAYFVDRHDKVSLLFVLHPLLLAYFAYGLSRFRKIEESLSYFERAIRRQPKNSKILEMYGYALARIGRGEEVIPRFETLIEQHPNNSKILERYYRVLTAMRKWDRAEEIAEMAMAIGPKSDPLFWRKKPLDIYSYKSKSISIDPMILWDIEKYLLKNPIDLLKIPAVRGRLSKFRRYKLCEETGLKTKPEDDNIIQNAVIHNVEKLDGSIDDGSRPDLLINPLMSIDYVLSHVDSLKVLTIGPRSEAEIFALVATGFKPENITGIDLISYSPFIDHGDMHDLPYDDESFDIVIAGWVLAYSTNNPLAAKEILRVCKPHAYIAVGCAYTPPKRGVKPITGTNIQATRYSEPEHITQHFEHDIERVIFWGGVERERRDGTAAVKVIMQKK